MLQALLQRSTSSSKPGNRSRAGDERVTLVPTLSEWMLKWNKAFNVISALLCSFPGEYCLWNSHFIDSLQLYRISHNKKNQKWICKEVGTVKWDSDVCKQAFFTIPIHSLRGLLVIKKKILWKMLLGTGRDPHICNRGPGKLYCTYQTRLGTVEGEQGRINWCALGA